MYYIVETYVYFCGICNDLKISCKFQPPKKALKSIMAVYPKKYWIGEANGWCCVGSELDTKLELYKPYSPDFIIGNIYTDEAIHNECNKAGE